MPQQYIEYLFGLQFSQSFHDALCEIDISFDGHFEGETISKIYGFPNSFECDYIFLSDQTIGV